jgi:hypothetical protein
MIYGNQGEHKRFGLKDETAYIENFLDKYSKSMTLTGAESDLNTLLSYVSKTYRERSFMIILSDAEGVGRVDPELIRKLHARHEIMFIVVEDSPLTNSVLYNTDAIDLDGDVHLSKYFRKSKKIAAAENEYREAQRVGIRKSLRRMGIVCSFIDSIDHAIPRIVAMLEEQKRVRR